MTHGVSQLGACLAATMGLVLMVPAPLYGQTATNVTDQYVSTIDQGVSDLSPLSASLIRNPADLRAVRQFDLVYPVPGRPNMLMRQGGALSAVFPYSDYRATRDGIFVAVPAGTVYYIGPARGNTAESFYSPVRPPRPNGVTQVATRAVSYAVGAGPQAIHATQPVSTMDTVRPETLLRQSTPRASELVTISDETYRRHRLRTIARHLRSND